MSQQVRASVRRGSGRHEQTKVAKWEDAPQPREDDFIYWRHRDGDGDGEAEAVHGRLIARRWDGSPASAAAAAARMEESDRVIHPALMSNEASCSASR